MAINTDALRKAIFHNTGWNFMCPPECIDEIDRYCKGEMEFDVMSKETIHQLNGIYRSVAEDYAYFTGGDYLPNIFVLEDEIK